MFIELIDVGIARDDNGMAIGTDATAPEHGQPILFNVDCIVYVRPILLRDGTTITEICYDRTDHSHQYWVKTSYGALKTLLQQAGKLRDATVTLIDDNTSYEDPKPEYDFTASNPFAGDKPCTK